MANDMDMLRDIRWLKDNNWKKEAKLLEAIFHYWQWENNPKKLEKLIKKYEKEYGTLDNYGIK